MTKLDSFIKYLSRYVSDRSTCCTGLICRCTPKGKVYIFNNILHPCSSGRWNAIISCILYATGIAELNFDETLRNVCMVMFFTSVGFQANMKVLKSGGKGTFIFLIAVFALIIIQNSTAVGLSKILHLNPLGSLMSGPLANNLIKKKDLTKTAVYEDDSMLIEEEVKQKREVSMYAPAVYQLCLAMGI